MYFLLKFLKKYSMNDELLKYRNISKYTHSNDIQKKKRKKILPYINVFSVQILYQQDYLWFGISNNIFYQE